MTTRVSARDIAERSGVSVPAVYLALSGRGRLGKETRQRIRSIADQMGYRPNAAARAVRAGRFGGIALLGSYDGSGTAVSSRVVTAVQRESARRDLHLSFALMRDEELTNPDRVPKILRELAVDGLLISYIADDPPQMRRLIDELALPAIWVNNKRDHDCIYPDDFGGARQATRRLLELGHRRISMLRFGDSHHYSVIDRAAGYKAAMSEAGLKPHYLTAPRFDVLSERSQWIGSWLSAPDRPTAVLGYEREEGMAVLWEAMRRGIRVPEDLSIVFISEGRDTAVGIEVSMMRLPQYEIGREAVELVERRIAQPRKRLEPVVMPLKPVDGQTCGPAPA